MPIIGIGPGTSNSAAAVLRGGRPIIIPSAEGITLGGKAFLRYVALTADGQLLLGEPARRFPNAPRRRSSGWWVAAKSCACTGRRKSPPEADGNRHLRPIEIATRGRW